MEACLGLLSMMVSAGGRKEGWWCSIGGRMRVEVVQMESGLAMRVVTEMGHCEWVRFCSGLEKSKAG
ncbi:hypothetical protein V6N13_048525 [Hibiscus sabdariffa]|uniref:Uncharacterized protein n=1 Tax=Hibiscus sabdariffa TaxID=183260 RepID=A0ABR2F7H0_9ROSI